MARGWKCRSVSCLVPNEGILPDRANDSGQSTDGNVDSPSKTTLTARSEKFGIHDKEATPWQRSADIALDQPGWFLVRAITNVTHTFRFASTAPWYVESPEAKHRVSRRSAQFFLDWVNERIEGSVTNANERHAVMTWHLQARKFWSEKVAAATCD